MHTHSCKRVSLAALVCGQHLLMPGSDLCSGAMSTCCLMHVRAHGFLTNVHRYVHCTGRDMSSGFHIHHVPVPTSNSVTGNFRNCTVNLAGALHLLCFVSSTVCALFDTICASFCLQRRQEQAQRLHMLCQFQNAAVYAPWGAAATPTRCRQQH